MLLVVRVVHAFRGERLGSTESALIEVWRPRLIVFAVPAKRLVFHKTLSWTRAYIADHQSLQKRCNDLDLLHNDSRPAEFHYVYILRTIN